MPMAARRSLLASILLAGLPSVRSAPCSSTWGQCGGAAWRGSTCCEPGAYCRADSRWYSQCVPASAPTPSAPTPSPPTPSPQPPTSEPSGCAGFCGLRKLESEECGTGDRASCSESFITKGDVAVPCTWTGCGCVAKTGQLQVCPGLAATCGTAPTPAPTRPPTPSPTPSPPATAPPTPAPRPAPTAAPTPRPAPPSWDGANMKMTHYWDCSGQGCDATTLQPWDVSKYVSPPGYGPQDPADFGGALYGEKMWLTGAASDALSSLMGASDGCCGADQFGGCGKCALVQIPTAVNSEWTAVVMKKNRCPPEAAGCGASQPHFDVAAPGFDNLQWSLSNICGLRPGTGFANQSQSTALGSWWTQCQDTAQCQHLCDALPSAFRKGCKLFASWGWKQGNPGQVRYKAVPCPSAFVQHVAGLFGPKGVLPAPSLLQQQLQQQQLQQQQAEAQRRKRSLRSRHLGASVLLQLQQRRGRGQSPREDL